MRKKLVLLINPQVATKRGVRLPLSILALGAALEGKCDYTFIDGNIDPDPVQTALDAVSAGNIDLIGVSVMPGPQVAKAIEISGTLRSAYPQVPILWGGFFPTMYTEASMNARYVDFVARGQGEDTLLQLLESLPGAMEDQSVLKHIAGLSWKDREQVVHNPDRPFRSPDEFPMYPYEALMDLTPYLRPSFMGERTAVHQASNGCRYHCKFCGVVSMFNGVTRLQEPERLAQTMKLLRDRHGATAMQFYDNNFFDREETSIPMLETMARIEMPWWCYARADTLAEFSSRTWETIRQSKLKMAFIGAEAASDETLIRMKKGTKVEHTLEAAARMREYGVIPEFSFILGGPEDPESEIEKTFGFIKKVKKVHPECEVILYFYSPTPQRGTAAMKTYGPLGPALPATPEEWTQKKWVSWVCHEDAPWLTSRIRRRVKDFAKVLYCRYPTVQDYHTPAWGKTLLKSLAGWRYESGRYEHPWEIDVARRLIHVREPQKESL